MTTKVTITRDDSDKLVIVKTHNTVSQGQDMITHNLMPGESLDVYLHMYQSVTILEGPDIPKNVATGEAE